MTEPETSTPDEPPVSYEDANAELARIVAELESGDIDVDGLADAVSRATVLITQCRTRLRRVESDLDEALAGLEPDTER